MRDFINQLDEISTAFRGYDKEEVMLYIKDLLQYCEEEKKKDMDKLIEQSNTLRKELNEAKTREQLQKSQYEALLEKFEKLSEAMSDGAKHTAERDAQLDEFLKKQDEIDNLLAKTREKAEQEKKELMSETLERCKHLIADAEDKKQQILKKGEEYLSIVRSRALEENKKVVEETLYLRGELDKLAEKLKPILYPEGKGESSNADSRTNSVAGTQAEGLVSNDVKGL